MKATASDMVNYIGTGTDQFGTSYGITYRLGPIYTAPGTHAKLLVVNDVPASWSGHFSEDPNFPWWSFLTLGEYFVQDVADPGYGASCFVSYNSKPY